MPDPASLSQAAGRLHQKMNGDELLRKKAKAIVEAIHKLNCQA
jgi:hypothetical protein